MTRVPFDVNGEVLIKRLTKLGYGRERQSGSHVTCTTQVKGEHHAYIPLHSPVSPGTLRKILQDIADHHKLDVQDLIKLLKL